MKWQVNRVQTVSLFFFLSISFHFSACPRSLRVTWLAYAKAHFHFGGI